MENFKVDGIECEVDRRLRIYHTGSAPYCYDGEIVVEPGNILQVVARYKKHVWSVLFNINEHSEKHIKDTVTVGLRMVIERFESLRSRK